MIRETDIEVAVGRQDDAIDAAWYEVGDSQLISRLNTRAAVRASFRLKPIDHPDDHFLAYVAAFTARNGALIESGFERNRVGIHIDAEPRPAALDTDRFHVRLGCASRTGA